MATLYVEKLRTNTIRFRLGANYSADTLTSQIRVAKDDESQLIAEWEIVPEPDTDPEDGYYLFILDVSKLPSDMVDQGYMDIKRVSGGVPIPGPIKRRYITIKFVEVVTP